MWEARVARKRFLVESSADMWEARKVEAAAISESIVDVGGRVYVVVLYVCVGFDEGRMSRLVVISFNLLLVRVPGLCFVFVFLFSEFSAEMC
jgi:hypothetical protein